MVNYSQKQTSLVFKALSDTTRRQMIERLSRGPATVSELGAPFDMSAPAISKHVRLLESAGLLTRTIEGRTHRCALQTDTLIRALQWIEQQRTFWEESLDKLDRYFVKKKTEQG